MFFFCAEIYRTQKNIFNNPRYYYRTYELNPSDTTNIINVKVGEDRWIDRWFRLEGPMFGMAI